MKELTPYEQFLADTLRELPVPDENHAWEEMKKLLEEEEDDRPLLPPVFRGCLPWLIGAFLIGAGILLWYNYQSRSADKNPDSQVSLNTPDARSRVKDSIDHAGLAVSPADSAYWKYQTGSPSQPSNNSEEETGPQNVTKPVNGKVAPSNDQKASATNGINSVGVQRGKSRSVVQDTGSRRVDNLNARRSGSVRGNMKSSVQNPGEERDNDEIVIAGSLKKPVKNTGSKEVEEEETVDTTAFWPSTMNNLSTDPERPDSIEKEDKEVIDSSIRKQIKIDSINVKEDPASKKKVRTPFTFAAGLAINQYIPVNGEKPIPYDFMGRKGSLGDYIPSVYFRALKPRWFIQGEFRYGAPNNVKEFVYSSKTSTDTFQFATTSSKTLKKTFYHQVPVTFNYFITKNWSVGVGIAYNKFTRAVRQEDVRLRIPGSNLDTLLSSDLIQDGKDTAFVTNSFQWIGETQYRWRRFSLGLRFAQGLQPYIKYTDPVTGLPAEKRNQSLNAFLRYDIWRSKKK